MSLNENRFSYTKRNSYIYYSFTVTHMLKKQYEITAEPDAFCFSSHFKYTYL